MRYRAAIVDFNNELEVRGSDPEAIGHEEMDWLLAEQIVEWHDASYETALGLSRGAFLIAAYSKHRPQARFRVAWKALDVWRVRVPARQAPAFSANMAFACSVISVMVFKQREVAMGIILCFCGLLRASEMLNLRGKDLVDCGDSFVVLIAVAKRGLEQKVLISHPRVIAFLRHYLKWRQAGDEDIVVPITYGRFQRWLGKAVRLLGLPGHWTSHGLRRGGATELLRCGISLGQIALIGRWLSERSMREYLCRGEVCLLRFRKDVDSAIWDSIDRIASIGEQVWTVDCDALAAQLGMVA